MGRKNRAVQRSRKKRRSPGHANREERNPGVISIWRTLDQRYSETLRDVTEQVDQDNDEHEVFSRIATSHRVFLLDPRRSRRELSKGFEAGFNIASAISEARDVCARDTAVGSLGELSVRRSKYLMAEIESNQIREESRAVKEVLNQEGARGFKSEKIRRAGGHVIFIAEFSKEIMHLDDPERARYLKDSAIEQLDLYLSTHTETDFCAMSFGRPMVSRNHRS
jgi:hypothetical protein